MRIRAAYGALISTSSKPVRVATCHVCLAFGCIYTGMQRIPSNLEVLDTAEMVRGWPISSFTAYMAFALPR